ncbi:MAG: NUDIX domain-containing protein [Eubacteriales bacterium]|nr:NUDIX domain-containing protein [Eubacteriales bacterium]
MTFQHCPNCGKALIQKECGDEGFIPFCGACNRPLFPFSYPCVICLVIDQTNQIALIKQSYVSDRFICVAGYVKQGETIEETAKREVEEETGLSVLNAKYIRSYYYEKRDNLMFGFVCTVEHADFNISGEVDSAAWFTMEEAETLLRQGSVGKDLLRDYMKMQEEIIL